MNIIRQRNFSCIVVIFLFLFIGLNEAFSHAGHSHGGSRSKGGARGRGLIKSDFSEEDTSKIVIDMYGNIGLFLAPDFGGRGTLGGDPLGTGGMDSWFYSASSCFDNPFHSPPVILESRIGESNFSYIPVWDPSELSFRLKYRFDTQLSTLIDFGFIEEKETINAGASWTASLNQLAFKWEPRNANELSLRVGHLMDYSEFSMLFGQTPLLNNVYQGAALKFDKKLKKLNRLVVEVSGGASFIDRVLWSYPTDNVPFVKGIWEDSRIRTFLYADCKLNVSDKLNFNFVTGIQGIPSATSYKKRVYELNKVDIHEKGLGWTIGLESGFKTGIVDHVLSVIHGSGDVTMGWGAPDYVYKQRKIDTTTIDSAYFSRNGSSLTNLVYWATASKKKLQMDWGIWFSYHKPSDADVKLLNRNKYDKRGDPMPLADSLVQLLHPGYNSITELPDYLSASTEDYSTLRFALDPMYKINKLFQIGLRYDFIYYFNPDAKSNTWEMERDEELNLYYAHPQLFELDEPRHIRSKWDMEAVNAHVISPHVTLNIRDLLNLKLTWSHGIYDRKIRRHGEFKKYHSNFAFSTNLFHTFSSAGRMSAPLPKINKEEAMAKAAMELAKLIEEGKVEESWKNIPPDSAEKKKFATGKQWKVHFYNDAIEDDDKCDIYIFLSLEGNFDTFNHFGE